MEAMFLSIDEDQPLAIWWADSNGCGAMSLDEFLEESKIDMSKEMAGKYAQRLQKFVEEMKDYSEE